MPENPPEPEGETLPTWHDYATGRAPTPTTPAGWLNLIRVSQEWSRQMRRTLRSDSSEPE